MGGVEPDLYDSESSLCRYELRSSAVIMALIPGGCLVFRGVRMLNVRRNMNVASGWLNASTKGNKDLEGTRPPFHQKQWQFQRYIG